MDKTTGVEMDSEYQHIIDIMGYKPVNDKGQYSTADIAEAVFILHEIDRVTRDVLRKFGANV